MPHKRSGETTSCSGRSIRLFDAFGSRHGAETSLPACVFAKLSVTAAASDGVNLSVGSGGSNSSGTRPDGEAMDATESGGSWAHAGQLTLPANAATAVGAPLARPSTVLVRSITSPKTYTRPHRGSYVSAVAATGPAGPDLTPATHRFVIP